MTQDEIIRMATEVWGYADWKGAPLERLERFAALVAAHEREKQAKQEPVQIGWQCADCKAPVRDGYTCDVCDSGAAEERYAAPVSIEAAVLAEREACAQVCDWILMDTLLNVSNDYQEGRDMGVVVCAAAIRERSANARARGEK